MMEKYYFIMTYGCQMNIHESEKIAGILENLGYKATDCTEKADVIAFNTCCIRETAEQKNKQTSQVLLGTGGNYN